MSNFRLLVTKKISTSLVLQAGLKGVDVLEKEFIRVIAVTNEQLNKKVNKIITSKNTVAFTSKNAVAAIAEHNLNEAKWKIFCIEGATKNEVRKYFAEADIAGTGKNALSLAEEIVAKSEEQKVIFFCGSRRMGIPVIDPATPFGSNTGRFAGHIFQSPGATIKCILAEMSIYMIGKSREIIHIQLFLSRIAGNGQVIIGIVIGTAFITK